MGRGVAYSHPYFMLINEPQFMFQSTDADENPAGEEEFYDLLWDDFKARTLDLFRAKKVERYKSREAYYIGETDRLLVGIDTSGGMPALFVEPKTYYRGSYEKEYNIFHEVERVFNKLIQIFDCFYRPTSAWTVEKLTRYQNYKLGDDRCSKPQDVPYTEHENCKRCKVATCGYSFCFDYNEQWRQQGGICGYEHCIENMPVSNSQKSCPLFGHDCPGGVKTAEKCRKKFL